MNKQILIDAFREISTLESNRFKSLAYLRACNTLQNMSDDEFESRKTFLNIPGIGMSLNTKILDFKKDGSLPAKLFKLREENKSYLDPQLYKIRKGFVSKRIPYSQAAELVDNVTSYIENNTDITCADSVKFLGSFRRHKALIADLDILVIGEDNYVKIIKALEGVDKLSIVVKGCNKTTFVFNTPEKTTMDVTWCSPEQEPFSILHFTGSAASNIRLRAKAVKMGYKLNQYGIYDSEGNATTYPIKTEEDIFTFLELPYVKPENR